MLLLEDRYVKLLGSALALILGLTTVMMAIAAAGMPQVEVAREARPRGEATTALPDQKTDVATLSKGGTPQGKDDVAPKTPPVAPAQVKTSGGEANRDARSTQSTANNAGTSISQGDIWLLAQVIHAEGRGESLQGQVAIGAVLLNRVRDGRFPNSLASVVYEPGAFCTVTDGQIYLTPDATALEAARLAASGWDPTGGALYFYNPARTTSRWIYSRPVINHIGRHVFAA